MADKNLSLGTIFTARVDDTFTKATQELLTITERLAKSMGKLNNAMRGTASAAMQYKTRVDEATLATSRLGDKADFAGKQIAKVRGAWERFLAALKVTAAYGIAASAIYKIVEGIRAGVKEIVDFDQALKNLKAISNASAVQVDAMGEAITNVARETKFSTGEVAEGMVLLAQAGFSAEEATAAIGATAKLATGTLSNMALTSDLLTTTIRAFGLQAVEASRVADVMANAINRSKLTIDKLRIAFNFVGAAAAQTGLSLEETAASMMVLANNGLRASTIGTGLRQVLSRLLAPNRRLREAFEAHGISLDKVNPRLVGFQTALKNLAPLIYDNEKKVVDMGKAYQLFGLRGAQAAAVLIKGFLSGDYIEMLDKVYEFGSATRMAETQAEGLGVKLKNLADRAKLVAVAIGDAGVSGGLRAFLTLLQKITASLEYFIKSGIGSALTQFTLLLGSLSALVFTLGFLAKRLYSVGIFIAFVIERINPLVFAIAGISAALNYYYGRAKKAREETEQMSSKLVETARSLELYSEILKNLRERQKKGEDVNKEYLSTLKYLTDAVPELKGEIEYTTEAWDKNTEAVERALGRNFREMIRTSTELIKSYGEKINSAFDLNNLDRIKLAYESILNFIPNLIMELRNTFYDFLADLGHGLMVAGSKIQGFIGVALWELGYSLNNVGEEGKKGFEKINAGLDFFQKRIKSLEKDVEKQTEQMERYAFAMIKSGKSSEDIIKNLKEMGATDAQIAQVTKYIERLNKVIGEIKGNAIGSTEALKKAALDLERRYLGLLLRMETDLRTKIKASYNKRLADIEKYYNDKVNLLKKSMSTEEAIRKASQDRATLEAAAFREYSRKVLDLETDLAQDKLRLEVATQKRLNEIKLQGAIGNEANMKTVRMEILKSDIEFQEKRVNLAAENFMKISTQYNAEDKKYRDAKITLANEMAKLEDMVTKKDIEEARIRTKERKKELKYELDHVERFGEDYVAILEEAYNLDMISYEEYMARKTAATEDWWENFKYGFEESAKALETFTELAQRVGRSIMDAFSTELTSAIWDFAEGTKTASQAMADFARSTIRWLGEIITKWAIMNAITGFFGMGASPGGASIATPAVQLPGYVYHGGGTIGVTPAPVRIVNPNIFANARRAHEGFGLKPGEVPIIAKKNEKIYPEGTSPNVTVNVINKSGIPLDVTKQKSSNDNGYILDVVVDAMWRNRKGFKDNMKGLMR